MHYHPKTPSADGSYRKKPEFFADVAFSHPHEQNRLHWSKHSFSGIMALILGVSAGMAVSIQGSLLLTPNPQSSADLVSQRACSEWGYDANTDET